MEFMVSKLFGNVVFIKEIESFITGEYHLIGLRFFKKSQGKGPGNEAGNNAGNNART